MTIYQNKFRPATIRLEKRKPAENLAMFFVLRIQPTLFGQWALQKCWGQIGSQGAQSSIWYETEEEAQNALIDLEEFKKSKGYHLLPVQLNMF